MFDNSTISLMLMLLLCFFGILVMFLFLLRTQGQLSRLMQEQHMQVQTALADMERQLLDIHFLLRNNALEKKDTLPQPQKAAQPEPAGNIFTTDEALAAALPGNTPLASFTIDLPPSAPSSKPLGKTSGKPLELRLDR